MLLVPDTEEAAVARVREWRSWMQSGDPKDAPQSVREDMSGESLIRVMGGLAIHIPAAVVRKIAYKLHLWRLVVAMARIRLATPNWGLESRHCRRNNAFDILGIAYKKLGRDAEAIDCLDQAWKVNPCPHNTSYGLRQRLYHELVEDPAAALVVGRYARLSKEFIAT